MKNKKSGKMTIDKLAKLTQKGFEAFENKMKKEIKNEISGLREEMSEKFDRVLTGQDQILKRLEDLETDNVMDLAVHHNRHEDKLGDHEKRIVVLEKDRINI